MRWKKHGRKVKAFMWGCVIQNLIVDTQIQGKPCIRRKKKQKALFTITTSLPIKAALAVGKKSLVRGFGISCDCFLGSGPEGDDVL